MSRKISPAAAANLHPDWMDTGAIADLIGLSREYVTKHTTKLPDFPAPVVNVNRKLRRWLRADVVAYFTAKPKRPGRAAR